MPAEKKEVAGDLNPHIHVSNAPVRLFHGDALHRLTHDHQAKNNQ